MPTLSKEEIFLQKVSDKESKFFELVVHDLLNYLGNNTPNYEQIRTLMRILSQAWIKVPISLSNKLTQREKQCLYLVSKGLTLKEIAKIMKISINTVNTYERNILEKLLCKNLTEAVVQGIKYNLSP